MKLTSLFLSVLILYTNGEYEYDYLVGARAAHSNTLPFVVGFNFAELYRGYSSCTGSLITRSWFVSAVHCTLFPVDQASQGCNPRPRWLNIHEQFQLVSCETLPNGDTKITTYDPPSMVWLGVNNIARDMMMGHARNIRVSYIIQPRGAYYQGGTYGTYGGYDIILGRLESPAPAMFASACIPAPSYPDLGKSSLAGYGKYTRNKCITSSYGPMKSHYCSTKADMNENEFEKRDKKGEISFYDGVDNVTHQCSTNPTPSSYDKVCSNFLAVTGYQFKNHKNYGKQAGRDGVDEVHLLQISQDNKMLAVRKCYRDRPDMYGWCQTSGDFTDKDDIDLDIDNLLYNSKDWGFCTKECKLVGNGQAEFGVLRVEENVDVLEERECDEFLDISLNKMRVQFRPKILCIGENLTFSSEYFWTEETDLENTAQWRKVPDSFIENNKDELAMLNDQPDHTNEEGKEWFLESAGTCSGDSGGPMFQKKYQTFILTGSVSGGRGKAGNCGGINNPTHYVRIKMFHQWIKNYAGQDTDWCEVI